MDTEADAVVSQVLAGIGLEMGAQMAHAPTHDVRREGVREDTTVSDADLDAFLSRIEAREATHG